MAYPKPQHSNSAINRAGQTLLRYIFGEDSEFGQKEEQALSVFTHFRTCHGYPINTFQSTLRTKLESIDTAALVMQRLKRRRSIILKLNRFDGMQLARMQDIGGLRAVTSSLKKAYALEDSYLKARFKHKLHSHRDYIHQPKTSGYRGIHLVYKYNNPRASEYNGLLIELQIRTRLQHYWATAVETMGIYLQFSLKSSEGPKEWLDFFSLAGSAFAHLEKTPPVPGYKKLASQQTYREVATTARRMEIVRKLRAFTVATRHIVSDKKQGAYHLIVLNAEKKQVSIYSYAKADLESANVHYTAMETKAEEGEPIQAVLVSAGSLRDLRKSYPNYFLDTNKFIEQLFKIAEIANKPLQ